jgi:ubiquinone biosynthesis protein UbiJ
MERQFEEVWLPRLREMWRQDIREEMERQFEEIWLPRLREMWREDLTEETRALNGRLDAIYVAVVQATQVRPEDIRELREEMRELRTEIERLKARVGLT